MNLKDITYWWQDFWNEFKQVPSGLLGLAILLIALGVVIFEPLILPFAQTNQRWRDITYWDDNPKSAPPIWINYFSRVQYATPCRLQPSIKKYNQVDQMRTVTQRFDYDYQFDHPSQDIILRVKGQGPLLLSLQVVRPDKQEMELVQEQMEFGSGAQRRFSINASARSAVIDFLGDWVSPKIMSKFDMNSIEPTQIIFRQTKGILGTPRPLQGTYHFELTALLLDSKSQLDEASLVICGRVSGLLGTDSSKRDIFSGLIAGMKWALLIGILTAVLSVSIGVVYGVVAAYFGGWIDELMNRVFEVFVSVPLLPVLIVMSAVFKPSIWVMIFMMCAFFWTGSVKTVRSMALQIKEETYIEATRAMGGSHWRLIFKHMVPILVPYSFASMALSVPGAIVYEATISLIGLGDATIVTWGQILHDALNGGAVLSGIWWWVIPPGLMISIMGMTFAFIGFAMDKILLPKLRTR